VLYRQGDPAEYLFVAKRGAVKTSAISGEGKAHTYDVLGMGRLAGATAALLGGSHPSTAEALKDTDVYAISADEFEHWLVARRLPIMVWMLQRLLERVLLP
jgi:CRP-like cAMP-binding protein